ncbi:hypothetical protein ATCC90586_002907 [Pythium insidiosum]|nr:hypothetical protein ATCC90586_002907 [Pythium insidiosum]
MRIEISARALAALAAALTLLVYAYPLLHGRWDFVLIWDDYQNFVENDVIHGLSLAHVVAMLTLRKVNVYEPLGWFLKALLYEIAGENAWPWAVRVTTLGLHIAAAAVLADTSAHVIHLARRGRRLVRANAPAAPADQDEALVSIACALSALAFAVHPLFVEVVAWPSAQPYALSALFSCLAVRAHCCHLRRRLDARLQLQRATATGEKEVEKTLDIVAEVCLPTWCDRGVLKTAGFYCLAVLSKSISVLLPAAIVLIDALIWWPVASLAPPRCLSPRLTTTAARYLASKSLFLALLIAFIATTVHHNRDGAGEHVDTISLSLAERLLKAVVLPVWVLRKCVWPARLQMHYPLAMGELDILQNPESLLSVMALALSGWWVATSPQWIGSRHLAALSGAYVMVMLLPVSGLVQHGVIVFSADRYAYFPLMVCVPWAASALARALASRVSADSDHSSQQRRDCEPKHHRTSQRSCLLMFAAVVSTLVHVSRLQMEHWRDGTAMLDHSLRYVLVTAGVHARYSFVSGIHLLSSLNPADWRLLDYRGTHLSEYAGGCGENLERCRTTWELAYVFTPETTIKGKLLRLRLLVMLGHQDAACVDYMALHQTHPHMCQLLNNVGICLFATGRADEARERFVAATTAPGCDGYRSVPTDNLQRFDAWAEERARQIAAGVTTPDVAFHGRLMW